MPFVLTIVTLLLTAVQVGALDIQVDRHKFGVPEVIELPALALTRDNAFDQIFYDEQLLNHDPDALARCERAYLDRRAPHVLVGDRFYVKYGYKFIGEVPKCRSHSCGRRGVMHRKYQCEITVITKDGSYVDVKKVKDRKRHYDSFLYEDECFSKMTLIPEYYREGATVSYELKSGQEHIHYFNGSPFYFYTGEFGYGTALDVRPYTYCEFTIVK